MIADAQCLRIAMKTLPGFDLLRLIAASAVVFSHAFLIADFTEDNEPFFKLTGQIIGVAGVYVFFVLSGFLISESAHRTKNLGKFAIRRAARILPAFLLCNFIVVIISGIFYARHGALDFFLDFSTWKHLMRVLLFQDTGLYYEKIEFYPSQQNNNWLPHIANGVLWTIRLEVTCYLFVAFFSIILRIKGIYLAATAILSVGLLYIFSNSYETIASSRYVSDVLFIAPSFAAGIILNSLFRRRLASGPFAALSSAVLVITFVTWNDWASNAHLVFPFLIAYPVFWLGQQNHAIFSYYSRWGDPSYGIYLWGWPVTQVLRGATGPDWTGYSLTAIALPITIVLGYASWHYLEAPTLRLAKHWIGRSDKVAARPGAA